jgi:hypothetical protein
MRGRASTIFWKLAHSPMKQVFAAPNKITSAKALEAGIHAAVPRRELVLMATLDAKPHDIKCRHIVLPTVKE